MRPPLSLKRAPGYRALVSSYEATCRDEGAFRRRAAREKRSWITSAISYALLFKPPVNRRVEEGGLLN